MRIISTAIITVVVTKKMRKIHNHSVNQIRHAVVYLIYLSEQMMNKK